MIHYLKIIRWPNLLIIILTQGLFRFCVIEPFYQLGAVAPALYFVEFVLLVLATVLIAAGGYVINDILDVEADRINKPSKLIAGNLIPLKRLKIFYWVLTSTGVILGILLSIQLRSYEIALIFPAVALLLWYYSARYQKTVLTGNIIISIMSALVVLIVWVFELFALMTEPVKYVDVMSQLTYIGWIAFAYALFAFLMSMIREILKDIEDQEGDRKNQYKTLVIQKGVKFGRRVVVFIQILTIISLAFSQFLLYKHGYSQVFWYLMVTVQLLLVYFISQTLSAKTKAEFHFLSNVAKIIMVAGILSMQLFYISL